MADISEMERLLLRENEILDTMLTRQAELRAAVLQKKMGRRARIDFRDHETYRSFRKNRKDEKRDFGCAKRRSEKGIVAAFDASARKARQIEDGKQNARQLHSGCEGFYSKRARRSLSSKRGDGVFEGGKDHAFKAVERRRQYIILNQ